MSVFSHSTPCERLALFQIAKFLPPDSTALEIGSHIGSSALFICAGLEHVDGHLYCVDTWMNQTMPEGICDTYQDFITNTKCFSSMITTIRKMSKDLKFEDIGRELDFVFIDGDHSEDAVRTDLRTVSGWVKVGGFVAFHDIRECFPGVNIVLGEALASGNWRLAGLTGSLGWLCRVR
jgi:predicted O-methyltransferase YrrM